MSACHREMVKPEVVLGQWWHHLDDGRIQCDLCPRECKLHEGQRGFCFVRQAQDGGVVLTTYGRASGFCIDPIEKKPLNHFYPGTSVLSFGTAGCNLGCRFCQNWDISKAREMDRVSDWASPEEVAEAAARIGCRSIAFTYNDPVIFAEYAIDWRAGGPRTRDQDGGGYGGVYQSGTAQGFLRTYGRGERRSQGVYRGVLS